MWMGYIQFDVFNIVTQHGSNTTSTRIVKESNDF